MGWKFVAASRSNGWEHPEQPNGIMFHAALHTGCLMRIASALEEIEKHLAPGAEERAKQEAAEQQAVDAKDDFVCQLLLRARSSPTFPQKEGLGRVSIVRIVRAFWDAGGRHETDRAVWEKLETPRGVRSSSHAAFIRWVLQSTAFTEDVAKTMTQAYQQGTIK